MLKKCIKLVIRKNIFTHKREKVCTVLNKEVNTNFFGNCTGT